MNDLQLCHRDSRARAARQLLCGVLLATAGSFYQSSITRAAGDDGLALDVRKDDVQENACITEQTLRARALHYARRGAVQTAALRVRVEVEGDVGRIVLWQAERVIARRRFEALPRACDDRRDTLAVAIALASDQVLQDSSQAAQQSTAAPTQWSNGETSGQAAGGADQAGEQTPASPASSERGPEEPEHSPPQTAQQQAVVAEPSPAEEKLEEEEDEREEPSTARHAEAAPALLRAGVRQIFAGLPASLFVFAAGAEIVLGEHVSIVATGLVSLPARSSFATRHLHTQLWAAEVLAGARTTLGPVAVRVAAGLVGGMLSAEGQGFDQDEQARFPWLAGAGMLALDLPATTQVRLRTYLDGYLNWMRPRPQVFGVTPQYSPAPFGAALGIELIIAWQ